MTWIYCSITSQDKKTMRMKWNSANLGGYSINNLLYGQNSQWKNAVNDKNKDENKLLNDPHCLTDSDVSPGETWELRYMSDVPHHPPGSGLAAGIWNPYITCGMVCGQGEPILPSWVDFQNEACLLAEITVRQRAREGTER